MIMLCIDNCVPVDCRLSVTSSLAAKTSFDIKKNCVLILVQVSYRSGRIKRQSMTKCITERTVHALLPGWTPFEVNLTRWRKRRRTVH